MSQLICHVSYQMQKISNTSRFQLAGLQLIKFHCERKCTSWMLTYNFNFNFEIILQYSCKNSTGNSHIQLTQFYNFNILYSLLYSDWNWEINIDIILLTNSRLYLDFTSTFPMAFFCFRCHASLASLSLVTVPQTLLVFHSLDTFKEYWSAIL